MIKQLKRIGSSNFDITFVYGISFVLSLAVFTTIAHEVVIEKEDWFDSGVLFFLSRYSSPSVISVLKFFTFLGSSFFIFSGYVILVACLLIKKRKKDAIALSVLGITAFLLVYFLKIIFARDRPHDPLIDELHNFSFPSGHSLGATVFFSVLIYALWKTTAELIWKWFFTLLCVFTILLVGISRIVLRFHYASDVVGGFSLGLALVLLFFYLFVYLQKRKSSP